MLKEMERKHLCEMLVMERLISEEKESDIRKATQRLSKEQQQERLFELKVCTINLYYVLVFFTAVLDNELIIICEDCKMFRKIYLVCSGSKLSSCVLRFMRGSRAQLVNATFFKVCTLTLPCLLEVS